MHPKVVADRPGSTCGECGGMALVPRVVTYRPAGEVLAVPESAVIDTGSRTVVYVERMPGMFDGVEVRLGPRCGAFYPVVEGLEPGQAVAVAGAFLVDAETRLNPSLAAGYFGAKRAEVAAPKAAAPADCVRPRRPVADRPRPGRRPGDLPGHRASGSARWARRSGSSSKGRDGVPLLRGLRRGRSRRRPTSTSAKLKTGPSNASPMIDRIIAFSIRRRGLVILAEPGPGRRWAGSRSARRRSTRSPTSPRTGDRLRRLAGPRPARGRGPGHLSALAGAAGGPRGPVGAVVERLRLLDAST